MSSSPYPSPEKIQQNFQQPVFEKIRKELEATDFEKKQNFLRNEVCLKDFTVDLRDTTVLAESMTMYYVATGLPKAGELAVEAIEKLMEYAKWDYLLEDGHIPIGVMRAQNANLAVSLACEYLGSMINVETRQRWIRNMASKGIELCFNSLNSMRYLDQVKGWSFDPESTYLQQFPEHKAYKLDQWPRLFQANNLRAVTTNGLLTGTICYFREFGETADTIRWLEQAQHSFATLGKLYSQDGSYEEGVSYSGYTSIQMIDMIIHLNWLTEKEHLNCVDWKGNARFLLEMAAPTTLNPANIITFSDGPLAPPPAVSMWLAAKLKDPEIQWYALNRTESPEMRALLHYDATIIPKEPPSPNHLFKTPFDWIVVRTGHTANDLVCAMRSGPPSNHEHADRNSIFLKCFGELLLPDPHPTPYSNLSPSWPMRHTSGHNAVLIDGAGHQYVDGTDGTNASKAEAHLFDTIEKKTFISWASDATQAYNLVLPDVASVIRSVLILLELPIVFIADKVLKKTTPSTIQARFFAFNKDDQAKRTAATTSFLIQRPTGMLTGQLFSPQGTSTQKGELPIEEATAKAFPYIEASTVEPSLSPGLLTLLLPTNNRQTPVTIETTTAGEIVTINLSQGKKSYEITANLSERIPQLTLV